MSSVPVVTITGRGSGWTILGIQEMDRKVSTHPLYRALRLDKMILAGLEANFASPHGRSQPSTLPVWSI